jgi:hypothetical protein
LAGESWNYLEDEKMKRIYGECQLHANSSAISNANFYETRYPIHHRTPVVFICKEGMRKDEIGGTQNLFAIFKGYRCGFVDRDAP